MTGNADLHFHTLYSDGKHELDWVVERLKEVRPGLKLAVLTDHDGVAGFPEFKDATQHWWQPICASELSCTYKESAESPEIELHLLVYGIDPEDPEMKASFEKFKVEREKRFIKIAEKLNDAGYKIDVGQIQREHPGVLGRPHIADALVSAGYVANRAEAFDQFLRENSKFNVKKWRFPLEEAVVLAKKKGWRTSIAHPGQYKFKEALLKKFRDLGVDAIEIFHPRHSRDDLNYYSDVAKRLGFLISGGSDFHSAESDRVGDLPSVGKTEYPWELARHFLAPVL